MVKVKICGITNLEDALTAIEAGADMLGFVFAPSPRQVTSQQAMVITVRLPSSITKIGVFVNSDLEFVKEIMAKCNLDKAQFHGTESPEYCQSFTSGVIKAFRIQRKSDLETLPLYKVEAYLLDSYDPTRAGGTGQTFDWDIARAARKYGKIILSGGLTPENVAEAIIKVRPYGVDVSSGIESKPGKKDPEKVKAFIKAAKAISFQQSAFSRTEEI